MGGRPAPRPLLLAGWCGRGGPCYSPLRPRLPAGRLVGWRWLGPFLAANQRRGGKRKGASADVRARTYGGIGMSAPVGWRTTRHHLDDDGADGSAVAGRHGRRLHVARPTATRGADQKISTGWAWAWAWAGRLSLIDSSESGMREEGTDLVLCQIHWNDPSKSISNSFFILLAKFRDCRHLVKIKKHLIIWSSLRD